MFVGHTRFRRRARSHSGATDVRAEKTVRAAINHRLSLSVANENPVRRRRIVLTRAHVRTRATTIKRFLVYRRKWVDHRFFTREPYVRYTYRKHDADDLKCKVGGGPAPTGQRDHLRGAVLGPKTNYDLYTYRDCRALSGYCP